jgi:predicted enzyme related to lactoylglutathione lyase
MACQRGDDGLTHPVVHWQLLCRDPERIAQFYTALFGWTVSAANQMGYRTIETGDARGIDGGLWPIPADAPDGAQLFVQVEDVEAGVDRAVELGAQVLIPSQVLPDGDSMALLLDPGGRPFGLMTRRPAPG